MSETSMSLQHHFLRFPLQMISWISFSFLFGRITRSDVTFVIRRCSKHKGNIIFNQCLFYIAWDIAFLSLKSLPIFLLQQLLLFRCLWNDDWIPNLISCHVLPVRAVSPGNAVLQNSSGNDTFTLAGSFNLVYFCSKRAFQFNNNGVAFEFSTRSFNFYPGNKCWKAIGNIKTIHVFSACDQRNFAMQETNKLYLLILFLFKSFHLLPHRPFKQNPLDFNFV